MWHFSHCTRQLLMWWAHVCNFARMAHMHHFLSVCSLYYVWTWLKIRLENNSYCVNYYSWEYESLQAFVTLAQPLFTCLSMYFICVNLKGGLHVKVKLHFYTWVALGIHGTMLLKLLLRIVAMYEPKKLLDFLACNSANCGKTTQITFKFELDKVSNWGRPQFYIIWGV